MEPASSPSTKLGISPQGYFQEGLRAAARSCISHISTENVKKRFSARISRLQLHVVDKWGIILSLSDSQISYHSLCTDPILKESKVLPVGRGCTALAVNTQIDKMCVSVKRTLVILSWIADDGVGPAVFNVKSSQAMGKFVVEREIPLTGDVPQKLIWSDPGFVFVGTSREYMSVNVDEAVGGSAVETAARTGNRRQAVMCALRVSPSEEAGQSWDGWKQQQQQHDRYSKIKSKDKEVLLASMPEGCLGIPWGSSRGRRVHPWHVRKET